jgi:hypothetical protein
MKSFQSICPLRNCSTPSGRSCPGGWAHRGNAPGKCGWVPRSSVAANSLGLAQQEPSPEPLGRDMRFATTDSFIRPVHRPAHLFRCWPALSRIRGVEIHFTRPLWSSRQLPPGASPSDRWRRVGMNDRPLICAGRSCPKPNEPVIDLRLVTRSSDPSSQYEAPPRQSGSELGIFRPTW